VSATQAILYGPLIAGVFTLLGVVAGLLAQHWLRRRGQVRIHVDAWTWWGSDLDTPYEPKTGSEARNFDIHVFNDSTDVVNISSPSPPWMRRTHSGGGGDRPKAVVDEIGPPLRCLLLSIAP